MGCWSVSCGISNIAITCGNGCVLLPIKKSKYSETREWQPATLPIFGEYNDYGGIENIEKDDNTKFLEDHFDITIEEFAEFIVDGKFTYDRDEAKAIKKKSEKIDEASEWQFMWIDRQVFDHMKHNYDKYEKGHLDYGSPKMMKMLGFEFVKKSKNIFKNYDTKRFNQLWKKGDVELFTDGRTILTKNDRYVYYFGKGCESSIETYIDVPEELNYLKDKTSAEAWRIMDKPKERLSHIMGSQYDFDSFEERMAELSGKKIPEPTILHKKYYNDLETYGDRIVELINVSGNMYPMSSRFAPHILYLTPQCGEHRAHQKLLEKFVEINKSYCQEDDED